MERRVLLMTICFTLSIFVSQSFGWELANKNLKLSSLSTTDAGVEFTIKTKKDLTLNTECKNQFIVPNTHAEYNLLSAFLLTASAQKKKVGITFDETSVACSVEVQSVVLY